MPRILVLAAVPLFIAAPATAAPVYLKCEVPKPDGNGALHFDVSLNEDAGTAGTYSHEFGYSAQGASATFTPDTVTWVVREGRYKETLYSVNRSTLAFKWAFYGTGIKDGPDLLWTGICVIAAQPERKF